MMKIQRLEVQNFKRFDHLIIEDIPSNTKLVLLIGENGSGKSSIFDLFEWVSKQAKESPAISSKIISDKDIYFKKKPDQPSKVWLALENEIVIEKEDDLSVHRYNRGQKEATRFYGRSSLRIVPRIFNVDIPSSVVEQDLDSPSAYIDYDERFLVDVYQYTQGINYALRNPVFAGETADLRKIFNNYIEPLNQSLSNIFGKSNRLGIRLVQYEEANPFSPTKLIFKKGDSQINYDLLSHGEKQVVIILLNFMVRRKQLENKIIFIDEMDTHINTALQFTLIKEITENWIPENSQLWTASHSLGFIEYAKKYEQGQIIDFDQLDYDQKQILTPISTETLDVYEIAVPKALVLEIFKNRKVVICENSDSQYYNLALGDEHTIFVPVENSREVLVTAKSEQKYIGLRDRDFLKEEEIEILIKKVPNLKILDLYSFENYLYHPDNIEELGISNFDKQIYIEEIIKQKNEQLIKIVGKIAEARQSYQEFKMGLTNDRNIDPIRDSLQSNDFEVFYNFFNMRDYFKRNYLSEFNLTKRRLVCTNWFKKQLKTILE